MNDIQEGRDYSFRFNKDTENDDGGGYYIELNSGVFEGVKFKYGKVSLEENEEKTEASLLFEYDVMESNGIENLEKNDEFKNRIGDILLHIVEKGVKTQEKEGV